MTLLERKVQELTCLYEVARSLSASLDIKATAHDVLGILGTVLGMTRGTLTLYDPATEDLVITAAYGLTPEEMARGRFKTGEGVTGAVFASGEPTRPNWFWFIPFRDGRTSVGAVVSKAWLVHVVLTK